jgi:hypothetical protein
MTCGSCGSVSLRKFESETSIHFSQLKDIDKHPVVVTAELAVCLHCGKAEFIVPEEQLALLAKSDSAHAD